MRWEILQTEFSRVKNVLKRVIFVSKRVILRVKTCQDRVTCVLERVRIGKRGDALE